ncbi:NHL repeat-containing family protein [Cinnamomum micranthum f. kanehirae]|uniref:NHL repeat-containing family protein n=1 Tax=Cinnamomum micranthum f. kanehirae TaxID=337451 RepID=A0A443NXQ7_9MAGN|nr:NHL repeat-containing family protein [Cinnamomum micranthum f. kanehirae]
MGNRVCVMLFIFLLLFGGFSSASATTSPAKLVTGFFSNALSALMKWLWSLTTTSKTVVSGRPVLKFESGYTVETVFDGSKLGIEPFAVQVLSNGELLVLDSDNSNIYKMSLPLSRYSRPKLVAGSAEGLSGHVDGKPREARMNHPRSITIDDKGNIYVADTTNMAIRKISEAGVTTIAGGKWSRGGGHVDGPSEDAKFSDDFEVVYIGSSCSLLVVDRGNQAIREIQLNFDDCAYQYGSGFPLGVAVLVAAAFFGYMLALLQRRVGAIVSSQSEPKPLMKQNIPPYQKPIKSTVRPPLIPPDDEVEKQEEGIFWSLGKLFINAGASVTDIFGGMFSGFRKKPLNIQHQLQYQQQRQPNAWPMQESFVIPDEDEPPPLETRTPTPRKTYAFMSKDAEKSNQFRLGRNYYNGWDGDFHQQQQQQQHQHHRQQQYQQRHYSSGPHTYYEQSCETTNEVVFGAVQEEDGQQKAVEIKAVDYGNPKYNHHNIRARINYMGYSYNY